MNSKVSGIMLILGPILTMGVWIVYNIDTSGMSPSEAMIAIMADTTKAEISSILNVFGVMSMFTGLYFLAKSLKSDKIYINLKALDKITAKTSSIRLALGETKFFGPLEIKALKCQISEGENLSDTVAYIQVKDLSTKDNNQVFLFNGWTFASSPTLQSLDHPIYDLWITSCENI